MIVEEEQRTKRALFPIQLRRVEVSEISYSCAGFPNPAINPISSFELEAGWSPFDPESKSFQVGIGFVAKNDPSKTGLNVPYSLTVRVLGEFVLAKEGFPLEKIDQW